MLTKSKIAATALAAFVLAGGLTATTGQAQAKPFHPGFGLGLGIGLATGTAFGGGYYHYHHCRWAPRFDKWGDYIGSVRVCPW
jgi:hypothetical protein